MGRHHSHPKRVQRRGDGNEVMPTLDVVTMLQSGDLPNPYYEIYPQAQAYATPGYRPVQTMHELLAPSGGDPAAPPLFRVGLVLAPTYYWPTRFFGTSPLALLLLKIGTMFSSIVEFVG